MPLEVTDNYVRERLAEPDKFDSRSFRTKRRGRHLVIVACPSGRYDATAGRCRVGLRAQAIRHPLSEYERLCRHGKCILRKSRLGRRFH